MEWLLGGACVGVGAGWVECFQGVDAAVPFDQQLAPLPEIVERAGRLGNMVLNI